MTACAENRMVDFFLGPKQTYLDFLSGVQALDGARNTQQPVRVHHGRDHSGSPRERHGNQFLPHTPERYPDKFFEAEMRCELLRDQGANGGITRRPAAEKLLQSRA